MPEARTDDVTIRFDDNGSGEPVLLALPGWCAGRSCFDDLVARLAPRHRVLTLDWRGHGDSSAPHGDFGSDALVRDALAVIRASGADRVVPIATAHAGWVAIELRRTLGQGRIPGLILVDWIVTEAPPPFLEGLRAMREPAHWEAVRDQLFAMWTDGVEHPRVKAFVHENMGGYPAAMWHRAAREIGDTYEREGSPLRALAALAPPPATLHLYAQPADPDYLAAQEAFAVDHPWFRVRHLDARSHFPTIEVPDQLVGPIEAFLDAVVAG